MLQYILEVTLCWSLFYFIFFVLLRKVTFYRVNRWYLLSSLILGILIPLLRFIEIDLYQEDMAQMAPLIYAIKEAPSQIAFTVIEQTTDWASVITQSLLILYFIGLGVFLFRFLKGLHTIRRLYLNGAKAQHQYHVLITTQESHLPFSFLKYVFISDQIVLQGNLENILRHELAHVQSKHSVDVLFTEVINLIFWFHPMVYLYKTALRQTHEYLADAVVLRDTPRQLYGKILLKQSLSGLQVALAHHFFHSHIKKRINMMYQKKSRQSAWLKYALALPVLILLFMVFSGHKDQGTYTTLQLIEDHEISDCQETLKWSGSPVSFYFDQNPTNDERVGYQYQVNKSLKEVILDYDVKKNFIVIIEDQLIENNLASYLHAGLGFSAESMTIHSPDSAQKIYGEKGKHGAVEILRVKTIKYVDGQTKGNHKASDTRIKTVHPDQSKKNDNTPEVHLKKANPMPYFGGAQSQKQSDERLHSFIKKNIRYPEEALPNAIDGKAFVSFTVDPTGAVSQIKILRHLGYGSAEEAKRLVLSMNDPTPKWTPGYKDGQAIEVSHTIPITFSPPQEKTQSSTYSNLDGINPMTDQIKYDTIIVYNPETFEESIRIVPAGTLEQYEVVPPDGSIDTGIDTSIIFNPETFQESWKITDNDHQTSLYATVTPERTIKLEFESHSKETLSISLYDMHGQQLLSTQGQHVMPKSTHTLTPPENTKGDLFVTVDQDGYTISTRVIMP